MTPQQLIDLNGYGQANKRLKAIGMWRVTINDTERIEWLEHHEVSVRHEKTDETVIDRFIGDYHGGGLRLQIDQVTSEDLISQYREYKES